MHLALILGTETATPRNHLRLLLPIPRQSYLCSDCTAVALGTFEIKLNPLIFSCNGVFVEEKRSSFIGHHHIEHAAMPQVGECDRATVICIVYTDRLRHIDKPPRAVVHPDFFV